MEFTEQDCKRYLLALPQEFDGYCLVISAHPNNWLGMARRPDDVDYEEADWLAQRLAELAKAKYPGLKTVIVSGPNDNTYLSRGEKVDVIEEIHDWVDKQSCGMVMKMD